MYSSVHFFILLAFMASSAKKCSDSNVQDQWICDGKIAKRCSNGEMEEFHDCEEEEDQVGIIHGREVVCTPEHECKDDIDHEFCREAENHWHCDGSTAVFCEDAWKTKEISCRDWFGCWLLGKCGRKGKHTFGGVTEIGATCLNEEEFSTVQCQIAYDSTNFCKQTTDRAKAGFYCNRNTAVHCDGDAVVTDVDCSEESNRGKVVGTAGQRSVVCEVDGTCSEDEFEHAYCGEREDGYWCDGNTAVLCRIGEGVESHQCKHVLPNCNRKEECLEWEAHFTDLNTERHVMCERSKRQWWKSPKCKAGVPQLVANPYVTVALVLGCLTFS
eukprot:TRINITY_DN104577_c0_g1_i1.p1 TRINITY_DN104577_c0_g1~~TRINITY_DN104577_c0_g1_i1.p1  ORF type:complete len:328 (+),score=29.67 TRINITY_DN104577_c0_g1_i1:38-1021(+)